MGGITVSAPEFSGRQRLSIGSDANNGAARSQDIRLRAVDDPNKVCVCHLTQNEASVRVTINVQNPSEFGLVLRQKKVYIDTPNDELEYDLNYGDNAFDINPDEEILRVELDVQNLSTGSFNGAVYLFLQGTVPPRPIGSVLFSASVGGHAYPSIGINHPYSAGSKQYDVVFTSASAR